ncbi:MAG: prolyl oligopeptidase family serine peptidase [Promethearchaeota archaeon]
MKDKYERGSKFFELNHLLHNSILMLKWLSDEQLWYQKRTSAGHEFILYDIEENKKGLLFDHLKVAAILNEYFKMDVTKDKLPLENMNYIQNPEQITFQYLKKYYRIKLPEYECSEFSIPFAEKPENLLSPDGKKLIFIRNYNVWVRNLSTKEDKPLTTEGVKDFGFGQYLDMDISQFPSFPHIPPIPPAYTHWLPDSQHIITYKLDQSLIQNVPFVESLPRDGTLHPKIHNVKMRFPGDPEIEKCTIYIINIEDGKRTQLKIPEKYQNFPTLYQEPLYWNNPLQFGFQAAISSDYKSAGILKINAQTGETSIILEEMAIPYYDLNQSPSNKNNVRILKEGKEVIWYSECSNYGHLYLYDLETGTQKIALTSGNWVVMDVLNVDEISNLMYFTALGREPGQNPYYTNLYRVNLDGTNLTLLTPENGAKTFLNLANLPYYQLYKLAATKNFSPLMKYVFYSYSRYDLATEFIIRNLEEPSKQILLEKLDPSALYKVGWQNPEPFQVKDADGKYDLYGYLYKPSDFDPSKKYPLIEYIYGGPFQISTPFDFESIIQWGSLKSLAELGFIVMRMEGRGSIGRTKDFHSEIHNKMGQICLYDHVAGIKQLAEKYSYIDLDHVGIVGRSYGGYATTQALLNFPDFFKVGVSFGGVYFLSTIQTDMLKYQGIPEYKNGENINPDGKSFGTNYFSQDSYRHVKNLKGKLMLIHGELDINVPYYQFTKMINALIEADKDFDFVYLPKTNHHGLFNSYTRRKMMRFFVKHLLGKEPTF